MICPYCASPIKGGQLPKTGHHQRVIDSRPISARNSIRRRRVCGVCEKRFTTEEIIIGHVKQGMSDADSDAQYA